MAHDKITKTRACQLKNDGFTNDDIATELGVSVSTVVRWTKDKPTASDNIRTQIDTLSKAEPTEANAKRLAMLSKGLERVNRHDRRAEAQKAKKPTVKQIALTGETVEQLKAIAYPELYQYQRDFLDDHAQFRLALKARQIGMTHVCALDALLGAVSGRNQILVSASEDQAVNMMRYIEMWAKKLNVLFDNTNRKGEKILSNGAYIKAMANSFRTVQGFTGDVWMDEFAWYKDINRMWIAVVPMIGAVEGRLTILSTPFEEHSKFHELCTDELKYHMFSRHTITIYDAIRDGLKFDLEVMRALFDADTWASAYECQFIDDESALLPISLIKECVDTKMGYYTPSTQASVTAGFDIGRTKDLSALAVIEPTAEAQYRLARLDTFKQASFDEQANILKGFLNSYSNARLKIDRTGIGMNLAETIKNQYKSRVEGIYFTAGSKEQLALGLRKLFEDKAITVPNDPLLIADLHAIKRKAGAKGFLYDSDRNEHGHADRFWAVALAASYFDYARPMAFNYAAARAALSMARKLKGLLDK
jgi:phage FluMu gp28-like protein/transposase